MKRSLNIGTLMLGSLFTSAALPAQETEPGQSLQNTTLPAQDATQKARLKSEHQLEERIRDLQSGLIDFDQLTPQEKKNEKVLLAALSDGENRYDALKSLTTKNYDSASIRQAVIKMLNVVHISKGEDLSFWTPLLAHPSGRAEVFSAVSEKTARDIFGDTDALVEIANLYAPAEFREQLVEAVKQRTRSAYLDPSSIRESQFIPNMLRSDPEVLKVFMERLKTSGEAVHYGYLKELGLEESVCLDLYKGMRASGKNDFEKLIYMAPDMLLTGEWRGEYLSELKQGKRQALARLTTEFVSDPEISAVAQDVLKRNPELLSALRTSFGVGMGEDSPFAREVSRAILSDTRILDQIVRRISNDFSLLSHLSDEILRHPRVSFGVRSALNDAMSSGKLTIPEGHLLTILNDRIVRLFPELLWAEGPEVGSHGFIDFRNNPRALVGMVQQGAGKTASQSLIESLLEVQQAASLLGITEFGRFDNTRELFRNRYAVGTPEIQEKLTSILGQEYFADIKEDTRPLCVVVNPASYADHNGAFLSRVDHRIELDEIDLLTCHYWVLYFEASDEAELTRDIISSLERMNRTIDVLVLGGHGDPKGILLGQGNSLLREKAGTLGIEDEHIIKRLGALVTDGGRIILESCSTAGGAAEEDNIARVIHRNAPQAHLYAPKSAAAHQAIFDADGKLVDINYIYARKVHFSPDGAERTESIISSLASDALIHLRALARFVYYKPLEFAKVFLLVTGAQTLLHPFWKHGKELVKSLFRRTREEENKPEYKQLRLFDPEDLSL